MKQSFLLNKRLLPNFGSVLILKKNAVPSLKLRGNNREIKSRPQFTYLKLKWRAERRQIINKIENKGNTNGMELNNDINNVGDCISKLLWYRITHCNLGMETYENALKENDIYEFDVPKLCSKKYTYARVQCELHKEVFRRSEKTISRYLMSNWQCNLL